MDAREQELKEEIMFNKEKNFEKNGISEEFIMNDLFETSHKDPKELVEIGYIDGISGFDEVHSKEYKGLKVKVNSIPTFKNIGTGNLLKFNTFNFILGNRFLSG